MSGRGKASNIGAVMSRHASEFIGGFIVAVAFTVVFGIAFAVTVGFNSVPVPVPVPVPHDVLPGAILPPATLDVTERFGWSLHTLFVVLGAVGLGQFIWGNGIRPNSLIPDHPSVQYTLSLPVSRATLIWSRYLFAVGGATLLMTLMLLINAATLWIFGHAVAFEEMAAVSLMGFLCLGVVTAAYGFLGAISDNLAAGLLVVGIVALIAFAWTLVFGLIAAGPSDSSRTIGLLVTAAVLLLATVYIAKRRDY